jgi:hypothetical protein
VVQSNSFEINRPSYPAVQLLLRYGWIVSAVAGVLPVAIGVWATIAGYPALCAIAGIFGGGFAYLLMRSYTELVAIIADMLLPK